MIMKRLFCWKRQPLTLVEKTCAHQEACLLELSLSFLKPFCTYFYTACHLNLKDNPSKQSPSCTFSQNHFPYFLFLISTHILPSSSERIPLASRLWKSSCITWLLIAGVLTYFYQVRISLRAKARKVEKETNRRSMLHMVPRVLFLFW